MQHMEVDENTQNMYLIKTKAEIVYIMIFSWISKLTKIDSMTRELCTAGACAELTFRKTPHGDITFS